MSDFTKAICGDWLNGKTVIVTGASGGMGEGIALHLLKTQLPCSRRCKK